MPRTAPGYDDYMPHDLAHYVVEESLGIRLGVFGQLAAGGSGIFAPYGGKESKRVRRTTHRIELVGRSDMQRSEQMVWLCVAEWMRRSGRRYELPLVPCEIEKRALDTVVERLESESGQWRVLQVGGSLEFVWPRHLVFDTSGSREGRRSERRAKDPASLWPSR
jgi:hypothetical protein